MVILFPLSYMTYGKTKSGLAIETLRSGNNCIVIKIKRESPSWNSDLNGYKIQEKEG